jgi:hypothetical protein
MTSEEPKMGKKRYCWQEETRMIPQKLEIIKTLESGESRKDVMVSYNTGPSTIYDIKK